MSSNTLFLFFFDIPRSSQNKSERNVNPCFPSLFVLTDLMETNWYVLPPITRCLQLKSGMHPPSSSCHVSPYPSPTSLTLWGARDKWWFKVYGAVIKIPNYIILFMARLPRGGETKGEKGGKDWKWWNQLWWSPHMPWKILNEPYIFNNQQSLTFYIVPLSLCLCVSLCLSLSLCI